eukprot:3764139-Rhodomonas_salina.1
MRKSKEGRSESKRERGSAQSVKEQEGGRRRRRSERQGSRTGGLGRSVGRKGLKRGGEERRGEERREREQEGAHTLRLALSLVSFKATRTGSGGEGGCENLCVDVTVISCDVTALSCDVTAVSCDVATISLDVRA